MQLTYCFLRRIDRLVSVAWPWLNGVERGVPDLETVGPSLALFCLPEAAPKKKKKFFSLSFFSLSFGVSHSIPLLFFLMRFPVPPFLVSKKMSDII